ncbi:hypothetical protein Agabi119p4_4005 [Agaricus bisporus var. burnettii]|uniref:Peptidase M20 dimerisation domain-containing protein n=1 Tax=Agaricus bisporus var. burnettii TaxID=192524 RepID=A0A8H7F2F3_AGABI|nr:hypothetical protein Agabi119p4_4005 [Agaricus bisporus var. burnettii]
MGTLPYQTQPPSSSRNLPGYTWRLLLLGSLIVTGLFFQPWPLNRWLDNNFQAQCHGSVCAQPFPPANRSTYSDAYDSPEFKKRSALRLSGAVKIPTMSFDDMGPIHEDERWKPFPEMHQYLETTFPIVHAHAIREVVGGYSLVYTLEGSSSDLKPFMLMAHMDVVPALTALDHWTYPPFEGKIDGDWLYGRGAADCKNNLIGILSALEHLLESGWKPRRSIVLAFGQDEEISGHYGAASVGRHLTSRYGEQSFAMIVDEGGSGLDTVYGRDFAFPGVAEKGYLNAIITVEMAGGHSSVPTPHTSIGILSKIVSKLEDYEMFRPHIKRESPIWGYLNCVATYGKKSQVPTWIQEAVASTKPDFDSIAKSFAETSPPSRYLVQTSKVATIFNAGVKENAMAEAATVYFNNRINIFSSTSEVAQRYTELILPIAKQYSLSLQGKSYSQEPSIGNITIEWNDPLEPSPISPTTIDNVAWESFMKAVQASFGSGVITTPSGGTGNTDTRHFWNLTHNIYRWSPSRIGTRLNIHTVDEKIKIDTHIEGIRFYTELILIVDVATDAF